MQKIYIILECGGGGTMRGREGTGGEGDAKAKGREGVSGSKKTFIRICLEYSDWVRRNQETLDSCEGKCVK
jgi:hypothetical protein